MEKNMFGSVGQSVTDFCENLPPPLPTWGKSVTGFGEIRPRLRGNLPPSLGKSAPDFGEISHPLWENLPPILGKSATDFGKNQPPNFGEN
jgi:hypothetical protein